MIEIWGESRVGRKERLEEGRREIGLRVRADRKDRIIFINVSFT